MSECLNCDALRDIIRLQKELIDNQSKLIAKQQTELTKALDILESLMLNESKPFWWENVDERNPT